MKTDMDKNIQIPSDLETGIEKMLDGMDAASRILADGKTVQEGPQADSRTRNCQDQAQFLKHHCCSINSPGGMVGVPNGPGLRSTGHF